MEACTDGANLASCSYGACTVAMVATRTAAMVATRAEVRILPSLPTYNFTPPSAVPPPPTPPPELTPFVRH